MKPKILKINLFVIFFLLANFVKTDIKHKGILYSEFSGIKANQARKLSKDDGDYMILYYKSEAKYSEGLKIHIETILHISLMVIMIHILVIMNHLI